MTTQLQSWRSEPPRDRNFRLKVVLATALLASLSLYSVVLRRPFARPELQVLILGPIKPGRVDLDNILSVDLPHRLARANSDYVLNRITELQVPIALKTSSESSLSRVGKELEAVLTPQVHSGATLMVYVSGVLSVGRLEPSLSDTTRDAVSLGGSMDIVQLIDSLQKTRCKHVLLCIDAVMPSADLDGQITASFAWETFTSEIERKVTQTDGTPIAIQLALSWIDHRSEKVTNSKLARCFASVFDDQLQNNRSTLSAIQNLLSQSEIDQSTEHEVLHTAENVVSANWPLESDFYYFPTLRSKITSANPEPLNRGLALQARDAKFAECKSTFESWHTPNKSNSPAQLRFPPPIPMQLINPYTYNVLKEACQTLQTVNRLAPGDIDDSEVQRLANCVQAFDQRTVLPNTAPDWIKSLPSSHDKAARKPGPSLVSNALLADLGMVRQNKEDGEGAYLIELAEMTSDNSASSRPALVAWLQQLPDSAKSFAEVQWCSTVLAQSNISWDSMRRFIQSQLLATRIASDPLAATACKQQLLSGDSHRVLAIRTLLDRSQPDWAEVSDRLIRSALLDYQRCLEALETANLQLHSYQSNFDATSQKDTIQILDRADRISAMVMFGQRWADALQPWNTKLAQKWTDGVAKLKLQYLVAESSTELQFELIVAFDRFVHSQMEALDQWLKSNAATIPKDSQFWVFLTQSWRTNTEHLSHLLKSSSDTLGTTVQLNLDRILREQYGATNEESIQLNELKHWWLALTDGSNRPGDVIEQANLAIESDSEFDLIAQPTIDTNITVRSSRADLQPTELQAKFDERTVELAFNGSTVANGQPLVVAPQAQFANRANTTATKVALTVRRRSSEVPKQPIVLVATRSGEQRRALIQLNASFDPLVELNVINKSLDLPFQQAIPASAQLPNQSNTLSIQLRNLQRFAAKYTVTLYALAENHIIPPAGAIPADDAKKWLASIGSPVALALGNPIELAIGQSHDVQFQLLPNQSLPDFQNLLVQISCEENAQSQFATWLPRVLHPAQYIRPTVTYNVDRQSVLIQTHVLIPQAIAAEGTAIEFELLSHNGLQTLAKSQTRLYPSKLEAEAQLSTIHCTTDRAILAVSVDQWRSSFVYEIDLSRSGACEPSKSFAAVHLQSLSPSDIVAREAQAVEVQVDAIMNDSVFRADRDVIKVGFDQNANRSLDDDTIMELRATRSIRFAIAGVTRAGQLLIHPIVGPHRVKLPITFDWNQRISAIAELHCSSKTYSSVSLPLIFDRSPPHIDSVRLLDSLPGLLGAPLAVELQVNDDDLSGTATVEGTWSTTGSLEFEQSSKPLPAVYREADRWLLAVPTEALPSGKSLLLVRATDRAGSTSKAYPAVVELLTQKELDAREASITVALRGDVLYGKTPIEKAALRLVAKPSALESPSESNQGNAKAEPIKLEAPKVIASTSTDDQGRFVLNAVPSGDYELELSGIVRGMRVTKSRAIKVDAHSIPTEIHFRLDQK